MSILKERKKAQLVDLKSLKGKQLAEQVVVITKKKDLMNSFNRE